MYKLVWRHNIRNSSRCKDSISNAINSSVKSFSTKADQRAYLDDVAKQFNISDMSDWYKLSLKVQFLFLNSRQRNFEKNATIKTFNNTIPSTISSHRFTPNTTGFHGNSNDNNKTFGTTFLFKRSLSIGLRTNST